MNELEKLKKLLLHWQEHNNEHAEVYREWSEKLLLLNREELSRDLVRLYDETKKLSGLFEEALGKMD